MRYQTNWLPGKMISWQTSNCFHISLHFVVGNGLTAHGLFGDNLMAWSIHSMLKNRMALLIFTGLYLLNAVDGWANLWDTV